MKKRMNIKEYIMRCLNAIGDMTYFIKNKMIEKQNREDKQEWEEPEEWLFHKLPDGEWEFKWNANEKGHGVCSGDFSYCLKMMNAFKFIILDVKKEEENKDGAGI